MRNEKVFKLAMIALPIIFLACSTVLAKWNVIDVGSGGYAMYGVVIGDVRNDGVNRIYATCANTNIYEFTYSGNRWNSNAITQPGGTMNCVAVGSGRNDGVTRLYGATANYHIYEFSYSNGSWSTVDVGYGGASMNGVALGNGRNDSPSVTRVYGACDDGHVYEFTYSSAGNTWTKVDLGVGGSTSGMNKITLAAGRNDGVTRLYAANNDSHSYEFTYSAGSWSSTDMGSGGSEMRAVAAGNGRNDGVTSLYCANSDGRMFEYVYSIASWACSAMDTDTLNNSVNWMEGVTLDNGRNDGVMRVYGADYDTHLYEFTYSAGAWTKYDMGVSGGYMHALASGYGRNDGKVRVYVANANDHIYEFTFSSSTLLADNQSNNAIGNAVVYPTFVNLSKGNKLNFANFTPNAKIIIFTLAGHVIKTMQADVNGNLPPWDGTIDNGGKAASGTYIIHASDNVGGVKILKILLIK